MESLIISKTVRINKQKKRDLNSLLEKNGVKWQKVGEYLIDKILSDNLFLEQIIKDLEKN